LIFLLQGIENYQFFKIIAAWRTAFAPSRGCETYSTIRLTIAGRHAKLDA
jgi:hypothetical protein